MERDPVPPTGVLAAELALGPYGSLEDACDAILATCTDCSCSGPRSQAQVGWVRVEGVSQSSPGGANEEDATLRVMVPTPQGIWIARTGVRAGIMWAANGDGYWEHVVRSSSVRAEGTRVIGEARVATTVCNCCSSAHWHCKGRAPIRVPDGFVDYAIECRRDARQRPWCLVLGEERGSAASGPPAVKFVGDELEELRWWSDAGLAREPVWFPSE